MEQKDHPQFIERYRPTKIADCILPKSIKAEFQSFVDKKTLPNIILSGNAGMGKTTVAYALCNELDYDLLYVNGSNEGRLIDTLRTKMQQFAASVSFKGGRKVIMIDEIDGMVKGGGENAILALRAFIEQFSKNCAFVATCNYKNAIPAPLVESRFKNIDFIFSKAEETDLQYQFFKRCVEILKDNQIQFDKQALVKFIQSRYPDFRRTLNELQAYSLRSPIDAGILATSGDNHVDEVLPMLKAHNFKEMRAWVAANDVNLVPFLSALYKKSNEVVQPKSIPKLVVMLNTFQKDMHLAVDKEIFVAACLTELMSEIDWV